MDEEESGVLHLHRRLKAVEDKQRRLARLAWSTWLVVVLLLLRGFYLAVRG